MSTMARLADIIQDSSDDPKEFNELCQSINRWVHDVVSIDELPDKERNIILKWKEETGYGR